MAAEKRRETGTSMILNRRMWFALRARVPQIEHKSGRWHDLIATNGIIDAP
jgi:L-amino acid N-acyltransferase YncA